MRKARAPRSAASAVTGERRDSYADPWRLVEQRTVTPVAMFSTDPVRGSDSATDADGPCADRREYSAGLGRPRHGHDRPDAEYSELRGSLCHRRGMEHIKLLLGAWVRAVGCERPASQEMKAGTGRSQAVSYSPEVRPGRGVRCGAARSSGRGAKRTASISAETTGRRRCTSSYRWATRLPPQVLAARWRDTTYAQSIRSGFATARGLAERSARSDEDYEGFLGPQNAAQDRPRSPRSAPRAGSSC